MNVMILAAGEGTRLRPFTEQLPKPAIPFLGAPLATYSLALLDGLKINNLVVNTYHLPEKIEHLFTVLNPHCDRLVFSNERAELLGSGGGIHNAKQSLQGHGDFIVMNGDEVVLPHQYKVMDEMLAFHRWHKGIATLMTMKHPEVGSKFGGAWLKDNSKIECFSKTQPNENLRGLHFLGVMILSDRVFKYFKESVQVENILYETLTTAMAQGEEVHAFEIQAEWFETGNPQDFMSATKACINALNQKPKTASPYWLEYLHQTVRLNSQENIVIEKNTEIEPQLRSSIKRWKAD